MSEKVLLAAPESVGLYKLIVKKLEFLEFNIGHIEDRMGDFNYKSVTERLCNVYRDFFLTDRSYKEKLRGIFDYPLPVVSPLIDNTYEVYYVSTFNESRASYLIELHQFLTQLYARVCFIVVINEGMEEKIPSYIKDNLTVQYDLIPFAEQLKYVSTSDLIIDLVLTDHNGFSFRIFEGIKYAKKVITTNKRVVEADFYHPNNYFVLNSNNYSEIKSFLELPYIFIDSLVKEKYSFTNWLEDKLED